MTSLKFTPGPWAIDPSFQTPGYIRAESGELLATVAVVYDKFPLPYLDNARLIASAPDLYKALREARAMLRSCSLDDDIVKSWNKGLATIESALAKAARPDAGKKE